MTGHTKETLRSFQADIYFLSEDLSVCEAVSRIISIIAERLIFSESKLRKNALEEIFCPRAREGRAAAGGVELLCVSQPAPQPELTTGPAPPGAPPPGAKGLIARAHTTTGRRTTGATPPGATSHRTHITRRRPTGCRAAGRRTTGRSPTRSSKSHAAGRRIGPGPPARRSTLDRRTTGHRITDH